MKKLIYLSLSLIIIFLFFENQFSQTDKAKEQFTLKISNEFSSPISFVTYSPDGKTIALASKDKTVKLLDTISGKEIRTFSDKIIWPSNVAYSPEGKIIANGSKKPVKNKTLKIYRILLWEVATGKLLKTLYEHSNVVTSVVFSPNGKIIASASYDKQVKLWNVASGKEIKTLTGHKKFIKNLAFSPDGKTIISSAYEKRVRIWDVKSGQEIKNLYTGDYNNDLSIHPSEKIMSTSSAQGIKVWDLMSGQVVMKIIRLVLTTQAGKTFSILILIVNTQAVSIVLITQ